MIAGALVTAALPALALDVTSDPKGVLPAATQQKLWDAYKTAKVCFGHPVYGAPVPIKLAVLKPDDFKEKAWTEVFTPVRGAAECEVPAPRNRNIPAPIGTVKLDERYGERNKPIDDAAVWFRNLTTYHRLSGDPIAADLLKQALVSWASNKGMAKGIHVTWGAKPVDYQMMVTIMAFVTAAAEIAPSFSADERAIVGPWLNDLVKQTAASVPKDRQDNKAYLRSYVALLWGLMVGDDKAVQDAVDVYKTAINDMRPDGSWPVDTQRGAMGLHYDSNATSQLLMMAMALKQARGEDLFGYTVNGRSVHTAVDWVVAGLQHPDEVNKTYAISCPGGGDSLSQNGGPNLEYAAAAGYLLAYAQRFPDRESSRYILARYSGKSVLDDEKNGAAAACLFASVGRELTLPSLDTLPALPVAKLKLLTTEVKAQNVGDDRKINSLMLLKVLNEKGGVAQRITFNIQGEYTKIMDQVTKVAFVLAEPVSGNVDALKKCNAIDMWDNGEAHVRIELTRTGAVFRAYTAKCSVAALPNTEKEQAELLLHSFRDVAITMASDGSLADVKHNGLKQFMEQVAEGEVSISD